MLVLYFFFVFFLEDNCIDKTGAMHVVVFFNVRRIVGLFCSYCSAVLRRIELASFNFFNNAC